MNDAAPWDDFQRDVLDALGHVVFRHVGAGADDTPPEDTPLTRALARAANTPLDQLRKLPPLDTLRAPAAKRALWPRLRAMRKAARQ
jgi:hypothetical protein